MEKAQPAPSLFDESVNASPLTSHLSPLTSGLSPLTSDLSPLHYQYKGRYIMTAVKSGLMIIDQHRADVRIRYERYMRQLADTPSQTQRLLFPETVDLTAAEAALMPDLLPLLAAVGFDLTPLGPVSYAVSGVPADIEGVDPVALLHDILADAGDQSSFDSSHNSTLRSVGEFSIGINSRTESSNLLWRGAF